MGHHQNQNNTMMITRITVLALLYTAAIAASPSRNLSFSKERKLEDDDYFCDCPCDGESSASVWIADTVGDDVLESLDEVTEDMGNDADTGVDDNGANYRLLCLNDDNVFDLLYDYGDQTFCNDECDEDSDDSDEEWDTVSTDESLNEDKYALDNFDLDGDGDVDSEDGDMDEDEDGEYDGDVADDLV